MSLRTVTLASLLAVAPTSAFAAGAEIRAKIVDLRVQPSEQAKARLKLGAGREVAVVGKSDDGRWVKVAGELERGEDVIKFEGWVMAAALSGDFGDAAVASAGSSAGEADWGDGGADTSSSFSSSSSDDSAGGDWDFGGTESAPAEGSTGDNSWDTPAASSASSSDVSWESSTDSSSESSGDDWGDSGSSSSDDSGDDWGSF